MFPFLLCREHGIQLPLFRIFHYYSAARTGNGIIDIEGTTGLYLRDANSDQYGIATGGYFRA